jgi:hypothetical protein
MQRILGLQEPIIKKIDGVKPNKRRIIPLRDIEKFKEKVVGEGIELEVAESVGYMGRICNVRISAVKVYPNCGIAYTNHKHRPKGA